MRITDYEEYFQPELDELNNQSVKNDKLYDEIHQSLEKNLERMNGKVMYGASTPHKDIASLGQVLNDIRSNQVQVIKEKSGIKKTIAELELKKDNQKITAQQSDTNESLMRSILQEFNRKAPNYDKPSVKEITNRKGMEDLENLDPKELGLNDNDLKMIDKFTETKGKR